MLSKIPTIASRLNMAVKCLFTWQREDCQNTVRVLCTLFLFVIWLMTMTIICLSQELKCRYLSSDLVTFHKLHFSYSGLFSGVTAGWSSSQRSGVVAVRCSQYKTTHFYHLSQAAFLSVVFLCLLGRYSW